MRSLSAEPAGAGTGGCEKPARIRASSSRRGSVRPRFPGSERRDEVERELEMRPVGGGQASGAEGLRILDDTEFDRVRDGFRELLPVGPDLERHLAGVVDDTLQHPGSLVRAQLAHATLLELGVQPSSSIRLSVAIEYFHTASLLFDDLPSMDDAEERRSRPCPHLVHGEAATVLAALGLINEAYSLLWEALGPLPDSTRSRTSSLVKECLGLQGILNGQSRDHHFGEGARTAADAVEASAGKTVPLIRLTLVLPALVGGATARELDRLESLSSCWGLAYQILDDFKDRLMDHEEVGKSTGRDVLLVRPSVPATAGSAGAMGRLDELLSNAAGLLADLQGSGTRQWSHLEQLQARLSAVRADIAARLARSAWR
jgi:geranylgeranyl diphosphate synthase type II